MNALHWIAGLIVLAEALNKLERSCPLRAGLSPRMRLVEWLKTLGWMALAMGSGAAVFLPLLLPGTYLQWLRPLTDTAVLIGFAILIIRTRVREGLVPRQRRHEDRT
jgi:hypothetical protein